MGYICAWPEGFAYLYSREVRTLCGIDNSNLFSYNGIATYVTENGLAWYEENAVAAVNDVERQQYLHDHIDAVGNALQAGCNVKGYFVWSFQVTEENYNFRAMFIKE